MQVDWFTVSAQLVNFLVLVWLLARYLYRPIVEAMAARERGIAERLAQAASREETAERRETELGAQLAAIARERDERLAQIEREAAAVKTQLIEDARREADAAQRGWREGLAREQRELAGALGEEIAAAVALATTRCLADLADTAAQDAAVRCFLRRLHGLDDAQRRALARSETLRVALAFEPDAALRKALEDAIRDVLAPIGALCFECVPELVLGVELRSTAIRVSWSVAEYLDEARRLIADRIATAQSQPSTEAATA